MTKKNDDEALGGFAPLGREWEPEGQPTERGADEVGLGDQPSHRLFSPLQLARSLKGLNDESKEVLRGLQLSGPIRRLTLVPDAFREICGELAQEFPNFEGYINQYLLPFLALSHVRRGPFFLPPSVFVGPPGVGKTLFVGALADRFGLAFERINLETAQASFELVGTSRGWSNYQPGRLLRWFAAGSHCNGIFVMEELDKAGGGDPKFAPINALIQLLEPTTAKSFGDQAAPELKLDVSPVSFVFTANTLDGISEPVLSRLLAVEIPPLSPDQARRVARNQYHRIVRDLGLPIEAPELTDAALETLSAESPRRQRLLLQLAIGRAIAERARELHVRKEAAPQSRGIGFL